jgi:uncharacterized membrane protein
MSEFVECQNCGRQFFAENLDCPYCGGGKEDPETLVEELLRSVAPHRVPAPQSRAPQSRIFGVLFHGFAVATVGLALAAAISWVQARAGASRAMLALEAGMAVLTLVGVVQRRRWGRWLAVAFILWNAVQGVWSAVQTTSGHSLGWGPIPGAILLFLWPFLTAHARERFTR